MGDDAARTSRELPPAIQSRIDEAAAAEAEAKARKAEADALAAELTSQQQERAAATYDPDLAKHEAAATSRKNTASAELEAAKARREQIAALIPDLSTADRGSLTLNDTAPLGGTALTFQALQSAATAIVQDLNLSSGAVPKPLVLVTTDIDLASLDATHHEVVSGLQELIDSMKNLPDPTNPHLESLLPLDLAAGIASAIPGVLSVLSARRTLTGATVMPNDTAAVAAISGALTSKATVVHASLRPVRGCAVYTKLRELSGERNQLASDQLQQARAIQILSDQQTTKNSAITRLQAEIAKAKAAGNPVQDLQSQLADAEAAADQAANALSMARALLAKMDALAEASDSFNAAIRIVGQGRSALATAALYEQLQAMDQEDPQAASANPERFTHVLYVRAQTGEAHQATEDKPFFMKDRFSTFAVGAITYMLMDVQTGTITAGGTVAKSASAHGKLGETITITT